MTCFIFFDLHCLINACVLCRLCGPFAALLRPFCGPFVALLRPSEAIFAVFPGAGSAGRAARAGAHRVCPELAHRSYGGGGRNLIAGAPRSEPRRPGGHSRPPYCALRYSCCVRFRSPPPSCRCPPIGASGRCGPIRASGRCPPIGVKRSQPLGFAGPLGSAPSTTAALRCARILMIPHGAARLRTVPHDSARCRTFLHDAARFCTIRSESCPGRRQVGWTYGFNRDAAVPTGGHRRDADYSASSE